MGTKVLDWLMLIFAAIALVIPLICFVRSILLYRRCRTLTRENLIGELPRRLNPHDLQILFVLMIINTVCLSCLDAVVALVLIQRQATIANILIAIFCGASITFSYYSAGVQSVVRLKDLVALKGQWGTDYVPEREEFVRLASLIRAMNGVALLLAAFLVAIAVVKILGLL